MEIFEQLEVGMVPTVFGFRSRYDDILLDSWRATNKCTNCSLFILDGIFRSGLIIGARGM